MFGQCTAAAHAGLYPDRANRLSLRAIVGARDAFDGVICQL